MSLGADGKLTLLDPATNKVVSYDPTEVPGFGGKASCSAGSGCKMVTVSKSSDGSFSADYGTNGLLLAKAGMAPKTTTSRRVLEASRRLQQGSAQDLKDKVQTITNPVICVNTGSIVLFDVNAADKRYPVYLKDSILNTN